MSADSAALKQAAVNHDGLAKVEEIGATLKNSEDKADTTIHVTSPAGDNAKDDCSDLTDNNNENEEQAPKTFPQKLMEVLVNPDHSHIISFLDHGNGFVIHKKKSFANEVLPKYFRASKFTSFTRKLNRWGFQRVPRGPETGAYYHKLFRRDKPDLILQMASNSEKKFHHSPLQHLLPNIQGMAAPNMGMFPYMPPQQAMMPVVTPQQQQALWQQQMQQMMQFQQMMQMQQQQAMQQAAAATAAQANMGAPIQPLPMNQNQMMMMMSMMQSPQQNMQMPSPTSQMTMGGMGGEIDLSDQQHTVAHAQAVSQDMKSGLLMSGGGMDMPDSFDGVDNVDV